MYCWLGPKPITTSLSSDGNVKIISAKFLVQVILLKLIMEAKAKLCFLVPSTGTAGIERT